VSASCPGAPSLLRSKGSKGLRPIQHPSAAQQQGAVASLPRSPLPAAHPCPCPRPAPRTAGSQFALWEAKTFLSMVLPRFELKVGPPGAAGAAPPPPDNPSPAPACSPCQPHAYTASSFSAGACLHQHMRPHHGPAPGRRHRPVRLWGASSPECTPCAPAAPGRLQAVPQHEGGRPEPHMREPVAVHQVQLLGSSALAGRMAASAHMLCRQAPPPPYIACAPAASPPPPPASACPPFIHPCPPPPPICLPCILTHSHAHPLLPPQAPRKRAAHRQGAVHHGAGAGHSSPRARRSSGCSGGAWRRRAHHTALRLQRRCALPLFPLPSQSNLVTHQHTPSKLLLCHRCLIVPRSCAKLLTYACL
jgi:hypothetical protein